MIRTLPLSPPSETDANLNHSSHHGDTMEDFPATMEQLALRVQQLELRVQLLEQSGPHPAAVNTDHPAVEMQEPFAQPHPPAPPASISSSGSNFPVVGKALLGIGGAFVLRALTESGSLPTTLLVVIAFAYACAWLVLATRVPAEEWFASTTYACSSARLLAPMLWGLTLRFQLLSPWATAGCLTAFALAASALGWKRNLAPVVWIANLTGVLTALSLMLATHSVLPFLAALLVMALASEYAADLGHWPGVRALVALAADLAIALTAFIYSGPENRHEDYPQLGVLALVVPAALLFLIYAVSQTIGTLFQKKSITLTGVAQSMAAFALAAIVLLQFGGPNGALALGLCCLLFAAVAYPAALLRFTISPEKRNYYVYSTWAAALFITGGLLLLPTLALSLTLAAAGLAAMLLAIRRSSLTLRFHAVAFLAVTAYTSGFADHFAQSLFGAIPVAQSWLVLTVAAACILGYALGGQSTAASWRQRTPWLLSAALAVASIAMLAVQALVAVTALLTTPDVSHIAVIRTLTLCALTLGLAFSGARWRRTELVWMAWGLLGLVGIKLLVEDLRHGHAVFTAISISLFAVTLILLPRLVRVGQQGTAPPAA